MAPIAQGMYQSRLFGAIKCIDLQIIEPDAAWQESRLKRILMIKQRTDSILLGTARNWAKIKGKSQAMTGTRQAGKMVELASDELAAISRLFSSSVVQEVARKGRSPLFTRLAAQSRLVTGLSLSERVYTVFDAAFSLLKRRGYRHEYIYKAALTHKIHIRNEPSHLQPLMPHPFLVARQL
jgi:hypothetical protein